MSNSSSTSPSRSSTPNVIANARFTAQNSTTEDLLKSHTVGLVKLSEFRKRRAELLEQRDRETHDRSLGRLSAPTSGSATPADSASAKRAVKKKRKNAAKGKLSFGVDEEHEQEDEQSSDSAFLTTRSGTPDDKALKKSPSNKDDNGGVKRRFGPNTGVGFTPKVLTKAFLLREAQTREQLRKEFLSLQEAVKATEIVLPFVFYDGTSTPGGICRVKKGDYIWLFLEKARKLGAELGVGGDKSKREWARVGVDDLMLVRGHIIVPHHYDFYYFIVNKSLGFDGPIFDFSAEPTSATPYASAEDDLDLSTYDPLSTSVKKKSPPPSNDATLEGFDDDPNITRVVDRRWYERNKHIFPASMWEEFDPAKDYTKGIRKDTEGNAFFFS